MKVAKVLHPDGRTCQVYCPDDTTEKEIKRAALKQFAWQSWANDLVRETYTTILPTEAPV